MFPGLSRSRGRDTRGELSLAQLVTACAAYSLALAIGLLLIRLYTTPAAPEVPLPPRDGAHPHQVAPQSELPPKLQRLCAASPDLCHHLHAHHHHLQGHGVHKRVSPRELSLAKWRLGRPR